MWKRNIIFKISIGMLTSNLKILLNFINIFVMKHYVKLITPLLE